MHTTFSKQPVALSRERSMELAAKLRAKSITQAERHELWEGHIPLALNIVKRLPSHDELIEIALLAIGTAIEEAPIKLFDDHFTWFCAAKIRSKLWQFLERKESPEPVPFTDFEDGLSSRTNSYAPPRADWRVDKLLEDLLALARNTSEEEIIHCRAAGYTDREIAAATRMSTRAVCEVRQRIYKEYLGCGN